MAIPSKTEIRQAMLSHPMVGAVPERWVGAIQNAYAEVERRGGIHKIATDIEAKIEAARARLAAKAEG